MIEVAFWWGKQTYPVAVGRISTLPGNRLTGSVLLLQPQLVRISLSRVTSGKPQHQTVTDSAYARPTKATTQQSAAPAPPKQNLDSMLGNLQADMSRQGVNTSQKGCCSACEKPIVGQVITALGKTWHPEHFTCAHCTQELGTRNFFERDGKPYCEPDYHNLFSPRCAYCNGPILDKCVTALEKTWHMEHFFCAQCGKQFGEEGFHEREGKPYCRDDYFDMFAPKCGACNRAIMENYISALNAQWHPDCFVCRDCKLAVQGKSFYAIEGKPVCPKCIGAEDEEEEEEED
ncbi:LIM domain [Popillia japonica]|uniref:LIM domain n=1 Tax=Popillia japonica TaxID=7064 RepID=A0AAW1J1D9_POPJA